MTRIDDVSTFDTMTERSVADFLRNALAQVGDSHRRGAEASTRDADPDAWDSSELVEWSANRAGAVVNDGSWLQYRQLQREGGGLSVEDALHTPGALVFTFSSDPLASSERPTSAGVAISLGNGQLLTVAEGGKVAVVDASTRQLTHASVIPGFADAREQDAGSREAIAALLAEHDLAPLPDPTDAATGSLFDPDGDGVPLSPEDAAARVDELRERATKLRADADAADAADDRHDAEIEIAQAVLDERASDLRQREEATGRAERAVAEARQDLGRTDPDHQAITEEVLVLREMLGRPRPSDDLMAPDGSDAPRPRLPEETDPVVRAALEEQLTAAEAKMAELDTQRAPLERALAEREAAATAAELAEGAARAAVDDQVADLARLAEPLGDPQALLAGARAAEAEAQQLVDRADEVEAGWAAYRAEHPATEPTVLPDLEVRVSGAEAYALGRRELAGELEQDAAESDAAAAAARRGAEERTELADLRDARAAELVQRADEAQTRIDDIGRRETDAQAQADEWAATADRRSADAARLEAAGRTDAAEVMRARAAQANDAAIAQAGVAAELGTDRRVLVDQVTAWREQASAMTQEADLLDEEAAGLATSATSLDTEADRLRVRAEQQDGTAERIEDALERGVATTILINDQGEETKIEIPGRAPVESDLDPFRPTTPAADDADEPAFDSTVEPEPTFEEAAFDEPTFDTAAELEPAFAAMADEPVTDFAEAVDAAGDVVSADVGLVDDGFGDS